jgi:hypothetical protein
MALLSMTGRWRNDFCRQAKPDFWAVAQLVAKTTRASSTQSQSRSWASANAHGVYRVVDRTGSQRREEAWASRKQGWHIPISCFPLR